MTEVVCLGVNHKSAPVELREKVAFRAEMLGAHLAQLKAMPGVQEAVVLSTCNRVELYAYGQEPTLGAALDTFLHVTHGLPTGALSGHLTTRSGEEAVRHLFRVAGSLDAIVVGEPQILGQVKDAFRAAVEAGAVGPTLSKVFHRAFTVAKRVRSETGIAQNAVSVSFAAVELARTIFGRLQGRICLLVGAGAMGELAARHFVQEGSTLWVCNRSYERAEALATQYGGTARAFNDLPLLLEKADVVLTSTAAQTFVVTKEMVRPVMRARRYTPLFFIDISVPRNVDPAITDVENVYAYDVDDLAKVVDTNLEKRQAEARKAEALVAHEVGAFSQWRATQAVVPTIKALRARAQTLMDGELQKTMGGLGDHLTDKDRKSITAMVNAVVNKLLHEPLSALKDSSNGDPNELAAATRRLFALDADTGDDDAGNAGVAVDSRDAALAALKEAEAAENATKAVSP